MVASGLRHGSDQTVVDGDQTSSESTWWDRTDNPFRCEVNTFLKYNFVNLRNYTLENI